MAEFKRMKASGQLTGNPKLTPPEELPPGFLMPPTSPDKVRIFIVPKNSPVWKPLLDRVPKWDPEGGSNPFG